MPCKPGNQLQGENRRVPTPPCPLLIFVHLAVGGFDPAQKRRAERSCCLRAADPLKNGAPSCGRPTLFLRTLRSCECIPIPRMLSQVESTPLSSCQGAPKINSNEGFMVLTAPLPVSRLRSHEEWVCIRLGTAFGSQKGKLLMSIWVIRRQAHFGRDGCDLDRVEIWHSILESISWELNHQCPKNEPTRDWLVFQSPYLAPSQVSPGCPKNGGCDKPLQSKSNGNDLDNCAGSSYCLRVVVLEVTKYAVGGRRNEYLSHLTF